MTAQPQVSWLIPLRDAATMLSEALAGVLAQEGAPPFEVVCVDDASTDGTLERLVALAQSDERLRIVQGAGTGLVNALNLGISHCRAPLLARMDGDDLVSPQRLRVQCAYLAAHPEVCAVGSRVLLLPRPLTAGAARLSTWLSATLTPAQCHAGRFIESPLVHPSILVRKCALLQVGGFRDLGFAEDWDLLLRLLHAGFLLANVPEVLLSWRDRPERLTRTGTAYRKEQMVRLRAHHLAEGPLRNRPFDLWGAGPTGKQLLRALEPFGKRPGRVFDVDPRKHVARDISITPAAQVGPPGCSPNDPLLLCAVGAAGARESIRAALDPLGWVEDETYLFCA